MRKILLIFDHSMDIEYFKRILSLAKEVDEVDIFPLTSQWEKIGEVETVFNSVNTSIIKINLLKSAQLINNEVLKIREQISNWSANLGDYEVGGKSLKEWFLVPSKEISTWWLSLISEKNIFKTDVFFQLAQIHSINKMIEQGKYNLCYLAIKDKKLNKAIEKICTGHSLNVEFLKVNWIKQSFKKEFIKECLRSFGFIKDILYSLSWIIMFYFRGLLTRMVMGSLAKRNLNKDSIIFITYFPAVEEAAAREGVFKNTYAYPLQNALSEMKKSVIWLLMYFPIEKKSYSEALRLGKRFVKNKEIIFFIEEFLSIRVVINSISIWFVQVLKYLFLIFNLNPRFLTDNFTIPETNSLLYPIWRDSFVGQKGMEGIVYFELYKKILEYFKDSPYCVYYAEMQAWEKALNAAKKIKAKKMKTIGFQHVNIGKNFFHYLYHKREMSEQHSLTALPMPDVLACNGDAACNFLKELSYPNLKKVEAVRHLYLADRLKCRMRNEQKNPTLLIVGSYYEKETSLLISFFHAAFGGRQTFKVWVKAHPVTPAEGVFALLKIDAQKNGYEIKKDPVSALLEKANMVLVGFSTVGLEALACGCKVFIPIFSDQMFISALQGFEKYYSQVVNPQDFKNEVERFINNGSLAENDEIRNFISNYWCLDRSLVRWEKLLS